MHLAGTESDQHDVLGIGNAIVDILAYAEEDLVAELGLVRGGMTLIDEERSAFLYRRLGPAREVSGGSCANTIAAVASLGGRAAYIGRVRDDQLGQVFGHDIRAAGVTFRNPPSPIGPSTATSM
ncbi:MAG: PfkB family carbohydrate kinase, partial [Geminicoccaceae bacterium]